MRRVDEWSEMASGAPDTAVVPRLVESAGSGEGVLQLLPSEWEVLAAVDGERTLRAIARELGRAEFEVAKAVFSLTSAGVVELGKRARATPSGAHGAGGARLAEADVERGRAAAGRGEWGAAVVALESAVRRDPLLASAYFHLGVAALRVGNLERAEEALATCARLADPDAGRRAAAERAASLLGQLRSVLEGRE
jgi:tetratricopeptide (TPR) repeat protein